MNYRPPTRIGEHDATIWIEMKEEELPFTEEVPTGPSNVHATAQGSSSVSLPVLRLFFFPGENDVAVRAHGRLSPQ